MLSKDWKVYLDELKYDVDVSVQTGRDGKAVYNISTNPSPSEDVGYIVRVRPDYSPIEVNNNALNAFGMSRQKHEDKNDLMERFVRTAANPDAWDEQTRARMEEHQLSPLHRVAVVAASARTDFQIESRVFAADPSFGGAGAGPNFVLGGGSGGDLSKIGIAHDTDWIRGYLTNDGPLWPLGRLRNDPPSGLHGLPSARDALTFTGQGNSPDMQEWRREVAAVPQLGNVASYDTTRGHPDWEVLITFTQERANQLGMNGEKLENKPGYVAVTPEALQERGFAVNAAGKLVARDPDSPGVASTIATNPPSERDGNPVQIAAAPSNPSFGDGRADPSGQAPKPAVTPAVEDAYGRLINSPGYDPYKQISVVEGAYGLIATQGTGPTALNVAVGGKGDPGDVERMFTQLQTTAQPQQTAVPVQQQDAVAHRQDPLALEQRVRTA